MDRVNLFTYASTTTCCIQVRTRSVHTRIQQMRVDSFGSMCMHLHTCVTNCKTACVLAWAEILYLCYTLRVEIMVSLVAVKELN